jgi:hypothetical protein
MEHVQAKAVVTEILTLAHCTNCTADMAAKFAKRFGFTRVTVAEWLAEDGLLCIADWLKKMEDA